LGICRRDPVRENGSSLANAASLFDDVYGDRPWHIEEQTRELERKIKP